MEGENKSYWETWALELVSPGLEKLQQLQERFERENADIVVGWCGQEVGVVRVEGKEDLEGDTEGTILFEDGSHDATE